MPKFLQDDPPVPISGKIAKSLASAMAEFIKKTGMSKSELLRRAISEYLEGK